MASKVVVRAHTAASQALLMKAPRSCGRHSREEDMHDLARLCGLSLAASVTRAPLPRSTGAGAPCSASHTAAAVACGRSAAPPSSASSHCIRIESVPFNVMHGILCADAAPLLTPLDTTSCWQGHGRNPRSNFFCEAQGKQSG